MALLKKCPVRLRQKYKRKQKWGNVFVTPGTISKFTHGCTYN